LIRSNLNLYDYLLSWRGDPHKSHGVRSEVPMYRHMPTCPQEPVSHNRLYWLFNAPPMEVETEEFRHELVARVRRQIADGVYETPEKWEAALERLAEELE
jgi:hypothetical protein